jgi:putative ABC transport system permease protein
MGFLGIIKLAFISLGRSKMRSFLTALGIIIGVMSVVAMVALGQGAYSSVQNEISKMGTNLIMINPGAARKRGFTSARGSRKTLLISDANAIRSECSSVAKISPTVRTNGQVIFRHANWSTQLMGVTEDYFAVRSSEIELGRAFSADEAKSGKKVCVVGQTIIENLFGNISPIGKSIRFKKIPLTIIGVLKSKGESSMGSDQDDVILAPLPVVQKRVLGIKYLNRIYLSAISAESVDSAKKEIEAVLNRRHRIKEGAEPDFQIRTQEDISQMAGSTLGIIALLLGSIASVSLLVGGIGIMNIMLVSVTERTKEIGIRMAIGAKTKDILYQFLVEAITLSCIGGIIGIGGGVLLARIIGIFTNFSPIVSAPSVVISFCFSGAVGIFFGLYPAWKASKLDPIEAFRYE